MQVIERGAPWPCRGTASLNAALISLCKEGKTAGKFLVSCDRIRERWYWFAWIFGPRVYRVWSSCLSRFRFWTSRLMGGYLVFSLDEWENIFWYFSHLIYIFSTSHDYYPLIKVRHFEDRVSILSRKIWSKYWQELKDSFNTHLVGAALNDTGSIEKKFQWAKERQKMRWRPDSWDMTELFEC